LAQLDDATLAAQRACWVHGELASGREGEPFAARGVLTASALIQRLSAA
jgi:hypothetical protein